MDTRKSERVFRSERNAITRAPDRGALRDDRLDRLLATATRVFARDGYERASMRTIARESGLSLAGLYHYVAGKENLLFRIQFHAFSELLTEVKARLCGVDDPIEQLRVLVRTHVLYVAGNLAALKVCSHELDALSGDAYEQVRRVRREYYELARSIIGRIIESRGRDAGLDRRAATMCLFGSLNWLYRWYDPEGERSPTSLANQVFVQCLAGLAGGGDASHRPPPHGAAGPSPKASAAGANAHP
ncbi:MAG: TetR/AcrR family transcriptional regulator [Phycisphaerae bacterium]|nr:TetR/AcrR family transcriptional regulator [Phycisphaerae bacterium]